MSFLASKAKTEQKPLPVSDPEGGVQPPEGGHTALRESTKQRAALRFYVRDRNTICGHRESFKITFYFSLSVINLGAY